MPVNRIWVVLIILNSALGPPMYADDSIHDAVRTGDIKSVRAILEKDPTQLNALDSYLYTPLDWAATIAEWEIFRLLIESGAEVTNVGWDGGTVLHRACHYNNTEIIGILIRRGVDLHKQNQWGRSALHVAARRGHVDAASLLIEHGLDPKATTKEGWSPLHVAAKSGHPHMMEFLLKAGADEGQKDLTGKTASEYFQPRPEPTHLDPREHQQYVGDYATQEGFVIYVRQQDGRLYITDFSSDEIYPTGRDEFYCRHEPWSVTFFRDETGKISGLDLSFLRRTLHCRKID